MNRFASAEPGTAGGAFSEPRWWSSDAEGLVCSLCFRRCRIRAGDWGYCKVRGADVQGGLVSPHLGHFSSCAIDPIEKKPLYHWRKGSRILSLGSVGCTMRCPFCQNHLIAAAESFEQVALARLEPEALLRRVREAGLSAVAYTYNEPALQAEYILEAAPLLKNAGIASVLVSNGTFSAEASADLAPWVDAANIDVKTFDARQYAALGGCLDTVKAGVERWFRAGVHIELTTLVVPGISDDIDAFGAMVEWVASISSEIPLHISRYYPAHRYSAPPTSIALMRTFRAEAERRLSRVHLGNVPWGVEV